MSEQSAAAAARQKQTALPEDGALAQLNARKQRPRSARDAEESAARKEARKERPPSAPDAEESAPPEDRAKLKARKEARKERPPSARDAEESAPPEDRAKLKARKEARKEAARDADESALPEDRALAVKLKARKEARKEEVRSARDAEESALLEDGAKLRARKEARKEAARDADESAKLKARKEARKEEVRSAQDAEGSALPEGRALAKLKARKEAREEKVGSARGVDAAKESAPPEDRVLEKGGASKERPRSDRDAEELALPEDRVLEKGGVRKERPRDGEEPAQEGKLKKQRDEGLPQDPRTRKAHRRGDASQPPGTATPQQSKRLPKEDSSAKTARPQECTASSTKEARSGEEMKPTALKEPPEDRAAAMEALQDEAGAALGNQQKAADSASSDSESDEEFEAEKINTTEVDFKNGDGPEAEGCASHISSSDEEDAEVHHTGGSATGRGEKNTSGKDDGDGHGKAEGERMSDSGSESEEGGTVDAHGKKAGENDGKDTILAAKNLAKAPNEWKRFDRLYRNPAKMKSLRNGESKLELFQKFLECDFDEAKFLVKMNKVAEMRKSRTDSLKLYTVRQMKEDLHYDEATIKKVVEVNEKKGWWRPDKINPDNKDLRKYLADSGGSVDATSSLTESFGVSAEMAIDADKATDLLHAGVLQTESWMGEQGIDDAMDLIPRGTINADTTDKEKQKAEREAAKLAKLAKRTPLEVGHDLLDETINFAADLDKHRLRCEGKSLARPTLDALVALEKDVKNILADLKQKVV
ncbi:unnamed protein product [Prorocentrum cordatum]|uniref:Uncharacterized protein n=1 Tax=Prorocentrum cordatum TaxID=2364126 RepID=A0ABN9UTZ8_9DINO|nr:unnamed protein product [Polarella glacialis]